MRKKILILSILLFLTGCTTDYTLEVGNDSFKENIDIGIYSLDTETVEVEGVEKDDQLTPFLEEKTSSVLSNDSFYKKKVKTVDGYTNVNLKYHYDENQFKEASSINLCFEYPQLIFEDTYYFNLQGKFYCLYGDSVNIKIKTNNKVYSNNADEVIDNVYIWHIDEDNQDYVSIKIDIDKGVATTSIILIVIIIALVVLSGLLALYFYKKRKIENEI